MSRPSFTKNPKMFFMANQKVAANAFDLKMIVEAKMEDVSYLDTDKYKSDYDHLKVEMQTQVLKYLKECPSCITDFRESHVSHELVGKAILNAIRIGENMQKLSAISFSEYRNFENLDAYKGMADGIKVARDLKKETYEPVFGLNKGSNGSKSAELAM